MPQFFVPGDGDTWDPSLVGVVRVSYSDAKLGVDEVRDVVVTTPIGDGAVPVDWELAEPAPFTAQDLHKTPDGAFPFAPLPAPATQPRRYAQWQKDLDRLAGQSQSVELLRSARAGLVSHADETERDFRIRVQDAMREARDAAVAKTRQKYGPKLAAAEDKVRRGEDAVAREQEQATESKVQAGVSIFATVAGALLGRKMVSTSTLGRATTAARGMGRVGRQAQDVARAESGLTVLRQRRDEIAADLERELREVAASFDSASEPFDRIVLKPKRGAVAVQLMALLWSRR